MKIPVLFFIWMIAQGCFAQSSSDIWNYIAKYKNIAIKQENQYNIPASIIMAQGILESGAGKSILTKNSNNHFGVKAGNSWKGRVYLAWDDESKPSRFRCYNSAEQSYADHAEVLLRPRYSNCFNYSVFDYRRWAQGLQDATYATAPNYAQALIGLIEAYRLYDLNGGRKLRGGQTVVIPRIITREELVERTEYILDDEEETEEQQYVSDVIKRLIVEINDVRCTSLLPGETLSSICMRYNIPKAKLLEYNELSSEEDFKDGDIVFLAKKKKKYEGSEDYYRAREGETIYQISQKFGIRLSKLSKMNGLSLTSKLTKGQKLRLK